MNSIGSVSLVPCTARAATHLHVTRLSRHLSVRVARTLAVGTASSWAVVMVVLVMRDRAVALDSVALRAIAVMTWLVGGLVALSAARDPGDAGGVDDLVRQHGLSTAETSATIWSAWTLVMGRTLGAPGAALLLLATGLAPTLSEAIRRGLVTLGGLAFIVVASSVIVALARACAAIAPGHGRSLLGAIVIVPWAAEASLGTVGSLPGLFELFLDTVARLGGGR